MASPVPARLQPLLDPASPVQQLARLLVDAGHECYLVGGSVRDAFLDRVTREGERVDVDVTTDARPDEVERLLRPVGRPRVAAGQALRHRGRVREGTDDRDHHVPRRGLPAREPQARGRLLRRHQHRPLPARLHGERDGAAAPGARARRSLRRGGRPRGAAPPHAARARGVVPRRSAAHAARGAVRRAVRARARSRARRRRSSSSATVSRS